MSDNKLLTLLSSFFFVNASYVHFVAGLDHKSGYPLLVQKACEAFMLCIPQDNFYVILHSDQNKVPGEQSRAAPPVRVDMGVGHLDGSSAYESLPQPLPQLEESRLPLSPVFERSLTFLKSIGVYHISQWEGEFSSERKMMRYLRQMQHVNESESFIYHTDLDEMPDRTMLAQALNEIRNGSCNSIM